MLKFNPSQCLIPAVLALTPVLGVAQTAPNAGTLLESVKPAPTVPAPTTGVLPEAAVRPALQLDDHLKIAVKAVRISGNRAFDQQQLLPLVSDAIGQELTLTELHALAQRITRRYRDAGYLLARAYLPAQDIQEGRVEIAVLEGRLGKLQVHNTSGLSDRQVTRRLAGVAEGEALDGGVLERRLLLLNDVPGVEVKSTLKPGASVGTTDLDIQLAARARYAGGVEVDNYGNRYTGELRAGGDFTAAELAGLGDALALRALTAGSHLNYGRIAYQLPVNAAGTQLGAAYSDMHYRLGKDFVSLDAHGTAAIGSLYLLHPIVRSRTTHINAQLNFDSKQLNDRIDATATATHRKLNVWTLGLSGDHLDRLGGGGLINWSLAYTAGDLKLDATSEALDADGHRTAGRYGKTTLQLARLQHLTDRLSVQASLQGQQSNSNLDSSEKMLLGGAQAVRAYPEGEAPADEAWLASFELRCRLVAAWQGSLFYDAAEGRLNQHPIAADTDNKHRLSGAGLGLSFTPAAGGFSLQFGSAWRTGPQPTSDRDRSPRVWAQISDRF